VKLLQIADEGAKIVFVRTKQQTEAIAEALVNSGLRAIALNGDLAQAMRERLIQQFRRGGADVLVATDIAARGLDVSHVTQVVNYDMPGDPETYVHRIGRTGRAGRTGQSILFVEPKQSRFLNIIERHTQQKIQKMMVPSDEYIQKREQEQFLEKLHAEMQKEVSNDYANALEKIVEEQAYDWKALAICFAKMHLNYSSWVAHADSPYDVPAHSARDRDDFVPRVRGRERSGDRRRDSERSFSFREDRGMGRKERHTGAQSGKQTMYRLAVGRSHGVRPGQIIGALANEGGIPGSQINGLKIFDDHAVVLLPSSLSKNTVENLKRAWVCGRQLHLKMQSDMI
jgi:ATP-dependent RNA helicase DeaD